MLKIDDAAPNVLSTDQHGDVLDTSLWRGVKNWVIYFYPKDETRGCTAQACSFRDAYESFKDLDCEVIGVSGDSDKSHENFAKNHHLPFLLLSDGDRKIRKLFQVPKDFLGLIPGRYTFVIDKNGIVVSVFHDALNMPKHVENAIQKLKELESI